MNAITNTAAEQEVAYQLAELLGSIGWASPCDAQWSRITEAIPEIRSLLQHTAAPQQQEPVEQEAEHFIQQVIDRAPEPLRRLGRYLGSVLDEDQWKTAERLLLGIAAAQAAPSVPEGCLRGEISGGDAEHNTVTIRVDGTIPSELWTLGNSAYVAAAPAAQAPERPTMDERGYIAACNLAKAIHARYYREDAPDFQVWPDTLGVITQIDNMVSGLTRRAAQAPSDAKDAGWISVKDRLPQANTPVLVAVSWIRYGEDDDGRPFSQEGIDVTEGQYRDMPTGGFMESFLGQHGDAQDITHWMPLPPAPSAAMQENGNTQEGAKS